MYFLATCLFFTHLFHCYIVFHCMNVSRFVLALVDDCLGVSSLGLFMNNPAVKILLCVSCYHPWESSSGRIIYNLEYLWPWGRRHEAFERHMRINRFQRISLQITSFFSYIFLKPMFLPYHS